MGCVHEQHTRLPGCDTCGMQESVEAARFCRFAVVRAHNLQTFDLNFFVIQDANAGV